MIMVAFMRRSIKFAPMSLMAQAGRPSCAAASSPGFLLGSQVPRDFQAILASKPLRLRCAWSDLWDEA